MNGSFHRRYLALVEEIEQSIPVADWRFDDVDLWPLARMDLYLDMYRQAAGDTPKPSRSARALTHLARPFTNTWEWRHNLRNQVLWPKRGDALFLGDGVCLDQIDGAWQDRYCEPLIAALEAQGATCELMQSGDMRRQPCHRPTFAANLIEGAGQALAPFVRGRIEAPQLGQLIDLLTANGIHAPSLQSPRLDRRARVVSATATAFEQVLEAVRPRLAFVVTYYAGLAPAFLLACRRRRLLSVDLQHCPQGPGHKAYCWSAVPRRGYTILPAIFWAWRAEDATATGNWTKALPWHRAVHGGHPRLEPYLDDNSAEAQHWDRAFNAVGKCPFRREILVALQTLGGHDDVLADLARQIRDSPPDWRWWIRRHPAMRPDQSGLLKELLSMCGDNIVIEQASTFPLPALLRHMTAVVSVSSGVAAEAALFGVPALFLCADATARFADLIDTGAAAILDDVRNLGARIAALAPAPHRPSAGRQPNIHQVLTTLDDIADEYAALCARPPQVGNQSSGGKLQYPVA